MRPILQRQSGRRTWRARLDEHLGYYMLEASNCRSLLPCCLARVYGVTHLGALCAAARTRSAPADPRCAHRGARAPDRCAAGRTEIVRFELQLLSELGSVSIWKVARRPA